MIPIRPDDRVFANHWNSGIDLRTHIAIAALKGILASPHRNMASDRYDFAYEAANQADALIEVLNTPKTTP